MAQKKGSRGFREVIGSRLFAAYDHAVNIDESVHNVAHLNCSVFHSWKGFCFQEHIFIHLAVGRRRGLAMGEAFYEQTVKDIHGNNVDFKQFKNKVSVLWGWMIRVPCLVWFVHRSPKVVLVVNVASACGNTPQYKIFQEYYTNTTRYCATHAKQYTHHHQHKRHTHSLCARDTTYIGWSTEDGNDQEKTRTQASSNATNNNNDNNNSINGTGTAQFWTREARAGTRPHGKRITKRYRTRTMWNSCGKGHQ